MSRMTAIFAGLVTLVALAGVARADVPALPFTLTTVDEFERLDDATFSLTGLVTGETTPRVMQLRSGYRSIGTDSSLTKSADACERAALIMSTHPGRFTLRISSNDAYVDGTVSCRLIRQQ